MRINKTNIFSNIQLSDKNEVPNMVQVLRVGKFNHPSYGTFEITSQVLAEMKANFDARTRGIDVSFDYYHDSNGDASAWVQALELSEDGQELWAKVEWTPKAAKKLAERELRYFSPDFAFQWTDPESGTKYKNVLFGGGLTNRPFVKEMAAIVASENLKGANMKTVEELQAEVKTLTEQNEGLTKKLSEAPKADELSTLKTENDSLKKEIEGLKEEKRKADEAKQLAEKENAFNVLLSEGKAVAAQKDAYMKGDMNEFVKLAQPISMKAQGSSNSNGELSAQEIIKLAEEKRKADPKLSQADAISLVKKENRK